VKDRAADTAEIKAMSRKETEKETKILRGEDVWPLVGNAPLDQNLLLGL
jgi:hypothetical protein